MRNINPGFQLSVRAFSASTSSGTRHLPQTDTHEPARILVVDDEPFVAETTALLLRRLGYDAIGIQDPIAALDRIRAEPEGVDLLLTDQMMPGVTGDILARRARGVRPDLPVVIMTGFSYTLNPDRAEQAGVAAVLMKPVAPEVLRNTIDAALRAA
jgi:two-component system cell cycle sensor histidine kinase/response regulator CckA